MYDEQQVQVAIDLWFLHGHEEADDSFASVPVDELIVALNLFFSAAGKGGTGHDRRRGMDVCSLARAATLFHKLAGGCECVEARMGEDPKREPATLEAAFAAVWCHYRLHPLQASICARVLGFYLLMERTHGAALIGWIEVCPTEPRSVMLHPAIVEALAVVPVDSSGLFSAALLISTVEALGGSELAN